MNQEKVSIITALHNKGDYVQQTIESVLAQTHVNWELIVVENHSSDDGPDIVRSFRDPRIYLVEGGNEVRGPSAARNLGIRHVDGDWVLFLDADDLIATDHLQQLLNAKGHHGATVVAGGWREFVNGDSNQKTEIKRPAGEFDRGSLLASSICHPPWAIHAAIVKRHLLDQTQWDESMDGLLGEDICFWFQVCHSAEVAFSDSATAIYRTETDNCRSERFDIRPWFEGIDAATKRNVRFVVEQDQRINDDQCEMLVRCYEDLYAQAKRQGNREYANLALRLSQEWLNERCRRKTQPTTMIRLRHQLGIPLYHWARSCFGA